MAGTFNPKDPVGVIVKGMAPASGGTGTARGIISVRINVAASATGTVLAWLNQEAGTVAAQVVYYYTTAGTGTVDIGVRADGTGSNDNIVNGGTMAVGVFTHGTVAATAVTGNPSGWFLVGSGTGIVLNHDEAATGTAVGGYIVNYFLVG